VVSTLYDLASFYKDLHKYEEAESMYRRALSILEKFLGSDHRDVTSPLYWLSCLYHDRGKYDEAEALYQRGKAIHDKYRKSQQVISTLDDLRSLYKARGSHY